MHKIFALATMLFIVHGTKWHQAFYSGKSSIPQTLEAASISILPANPLVEKDQYGQYLNFDMVIKNTSSHILDLNAIEVSAMDASDKLILRKSVSNSNLQSGSRPIGNGILKPGETITVFNPLYALPPDANITYLKYRFFFNYSDNERQKELNLRRLPPDFNISVEKIITPRFYAAKTNLNLPLKGRLIVWNGHDFYSRHRMVQISSAENEAKGVTANSNRYAYDLVNIDEKGDMYQNDPFKKENWYVFGKPVFAPAGGRVAEVQNTIPDNEFGDKTVRQPNIPGSVDPHGMGNHVIIDHDNGEFSVLLHLERGSIRVRAGEMIRAGQLIGTVGFSGNATFPHLHYAVMNGQKEMVAEGVPSYFSNYKLFRGNRFALVKKGHIDSGDIIESEK